VRALLATVFRGEERDDADGAVRVACNRGDDDLTVSWIRAVVHVESGGDAHAVSPKGAMGLMQIMLDTWSDLRLRYRLGDNPFDPHDNILGGTAYLRMLYDRFGAVGFLAAYNAGPEHYQGYLAGLRPLADETKAYLAKLARLLPELSLDRAAIASFNSPPSQAASLFVTGSAQTNRSTATIAPHPSGASTTSTFALTPQSNGLFVPVSAANR
jgi:hypothetical protein